MSRTIKLLLVGMVIVALAAFGARVFARDENEDEAKPGKGPVKAVEKALERLQNFEFKGFGEEDFTRGLAPSSLAINPQGHVRLTNAEVTAISGSSLSVKVWGLAFTVRQGTSTKVFAGKIRELSFSDIKVGDRIDVVGRTSESTPGVIDAEVIHDRALIVQARDEEVARLRSLIEDLIRRLQDILQRSGRSLPPGFSPLPSPSASPSPTPSPSPSPSPSPTPTP